MFKKLLLAAAFFLTVTTTIAQEKKPTPPVNCNGFTVVLGALVKLGQFPIFESKIGDRSTIVLVNKSLTSMSIVIIDEHDMACIVHSSSKMIFDKELLQDLADHHIGPRT